MSDTVGHIPLESLSQKLEPETHYSPTRIGFFSWVRLNFFSSLGNTFATICMSAFLIWSLPPLIRWAIVDAVWSGTGREACVVENAGACWAFVAAKFSQFMYGRYPIEYRWRVDLTFILLIAGLIPMLIPRVPHKRDNTIYLLIVWPTIAFVLLTGQLGFAHVDTSLWGGLLVTLVVAIVGIVASFPLGVLLALGRRSHMSFTKAVCIFFIEFWRGVPLITLLFMSSVMLPMFLPGGWDIDKLLRALIGVVLFTSAYVAEAIRGGLQAVGKGQIEAADSMALTYWQSMYLVVLPQGLKYAIPGLVNTFIGLFKDTSLVLIIGLFDLLGIVQLNFTDPKWAAPQTPATGYAFAAAVFWIFCFGMSIYSRHMERRLSKGRSR